MIHFKEELSFVFPKRVSCLFSRNTAWTFDAKDGNAIFVQVVDSPTPSTLNPKRKIMNHPQENICRIQICSDAEDRHGELHVVSKTKRMLLIDK